MLESLYFALLRLAACFNRKAKKLVDGEKNAFQTIEEKLDTTAKYVWFHAASVGEFEQGRPIIERLKNEHPERKIILTFFSPSGYELRKNYPFADIVAYLPFATRKNSKRFVEMVKPQMAIFIKYEFWPAYLKTLHENRISTYVIAAIFHKKQIFFRWYGAAYRKCLHYFTHLFVQDENSATLLKKYNINNVTVCGDTRFDRVTEIANIAKQNVIIEQFTQDVPTIIAGSTWPADEELLVRYYKERKNCKLILVPHEITTKHLHHIFQLLQGRFVRYTEATPKNLSSCNCMIIDTVGILSHIYRYATVAYIGGGFGAGIHNTLEPAVFGAPVVFGKKYKHFREACGLVGCKGGFSVKNYKQLKNTLDQLLTNATDCGKNAANFVQQNVGATEIICEMLNR